MVVTRRARLREELTAEIIEIGRRQLADGGVSKVNWRAIATEVGMNPASLYTYVDGINDLYTRILANSFRSLASACDAAARAATNLDARSRVLGCARAYRAWAVARPNEFNLIFTDQIPGYVAPSEGESFQAAMDVNAPFIDAVVEALTGRTGATSIDELSDDEQLVAYALRSMMHGFTSLEINHHSPYAEGSDDLMITSLSLLLDDFFARRHRRSRS